MQSTSNSSRTLQQSDSPWRRLRRAGLLLGMVSLVLSLPVAGLVYLTTGLVLKYEIEEGVLPNYIEGDIELTSRQSAQYKARLHSEKQRLELLHAVMLYWIPAALVLLAVLAYLRRTLNRHHLPLIRKPDSGSGL